MGDLFTPTASSSAVKSWMDHIEARLETMETQQRLRNSSVKGGALVAYTDDLVQVGRLGKGSYSTPTGSITASTFAFSRPDSRFHQLLDANDGWVEPKFLYNWSPETFQAVSSTSYTNTWRIAVNALAFGLVTDFLVACDVGTTGEALISVNGTDLDSFTIGSGAQVQQVYYIDMTNNISGLGARVEVRTRARRTSGSGDVNVWLPGRTYITPLSQSTRFTEGGIQ